MNPMLRLMACIAASFSVAIVAAIALAILDIYLVGHGLRSIGAPAVTIPEFGVFLSVGDLALLGAAAIGGLACWFAMSNTGRRR